MTFPSSQQSSLYLLDLSIACDDKEDKHRAARLHVKPSVLVQEYAGAVFCNGKTRGGGRWLAISVAIDGLDWMSNR